MDGTVATSNGPRYQLIRKAGPYETMTHIFHDLGLQSNILVCARYSHVGSQILTPARVFRALESVINEHPALSIIGIEQPSEKKRGNRRLWEARIPAIRFQDCVEFLDLHGESDDALARVFENSHNQWFDTQNTKKPWWRMLIINKKYAVFVYHHSIGDGISGYAFHRSFLATLNSENLSDTSREVVQDAIFNPDLTKAPPPYLLDSIKAKLSWLNVIFILWHIVRFFINPKHFFFSDANINRTHPTVLNPGLNEEKTITKVQYMKIKKEEMQRILSLCRQHGVSFTAILQTLIQITLASDLYPKAKIGFSRLAVNIRPLFTPNPGLDVFTNAASQYARKDFLGQYRAAGIPNLDSRKVWTLAQYYKAHLNKSLSSGKVIQDFLAGTLLGDDLEDFGSFYGLGLYQNNGYLITNIGVFEAKPSTPADDWSVASVAFSAAQIRAALSDAGIVFGVSSAKDGDCSIVVTYEEDVLKADVAQRLINGLKERLDVLR